MNLHLSLSWFSQYRRVFAMIFLMLLSIIISLPLFACLVLVFTNKTEITFIRNFSLFWSLLILNVCITLLFFFDITSTHFQFLEANSWFSSININVVIGIDGLSLVMILLTSFLIPVCILLCWNKSLTNQAKEYSIAFLVSKQFYSASFPVWI